MAEPALFWEKGKGASLHCSLCPHECLIHPGGKGRCNVRANVDGSLYAVNYGKICGLALDPIEKKPLYHFYPGSFILSAGSPGCNLACGFCQNWASVSGEGAQRELTPAAMVELALAAKGQGNCGIAFTYTEPLMSYEYVMATAERARHHGLKTVLVSNGFIQPEPWRQILKHIDAVNIDLKAFNPHFYREHCGGSMEPVLEAISLAASSCHLEVTTLLIPGHNTRVEEVKELSAFLAGLSLKIPLHLSRYFPARHWTVEATPPALIEELAAVARQKLDFVYTGNLPGSYRAKTYCPACGQPLVERGHKIGGLLTPEGRCPRCDYTIIIPGWEERTRE